tara:strand:+ start:214 stop:864 length:651 start_codon:yes stop_codon:yes gene_type:complete
MKKFIQFITEVNYPEKGSDAEKERWNKVNARLSAMSDEDREARMIGTLGKDKDGIQRYGLKKKASRKNQQVVRKGRGDVQTDPSVKKRDYNRAVKDITDKGLEAHHNVPLDRGASLFKGKSPEERQRIRNKYAKYGTHFGNDPRNLSALSAKDHRGEGGAHRQLDAMDRSIKKAGKESEGVFGKIKSIVRQHRIQQKRNDSTKKKEHADIVRDNKA